jgi:tRNA threonylcarbamoyl adenosine modification protein YeaZ
MPVRPVSSDRRVRVEHVLVLVLDTATAAVTAALVEIAEVTQPGGTKVLAERVTVDGRAHGELLAPQIESVLAEGGAKARDLTAIIAGVGPGPFTGLRVGLVTAASLSASLGVPSYGVCTLDALGAATGQAPGRVLVATDARRREIYWSVYEAGLPLTPPAVNRPADVAPELVRHGVRTAVGAGAELYAEVLGVPVVEPRFPPAAELAWLAGPRVRDRAPAELLIPLYLRRPDAVEPADRKPALAPGER